MEVQSCKSATGGPASTLPCNTMRVTATLVNHAARRQSTSSYCSLTLDAPCDKGSAPCDMSVCVLMLQVQQARQQTGVHGCTLCWLRRLQQANAAQSRDRPPHNFSRDAMDRNSCDHTRPHATKRCFTAADSALSLLVIPILSSDMCLRTERT